MTTRGTFKKVNRMVSLILCFFFLLEPRQYVGAQVAAQLDISAQFAGLRNPFSADKFRPIHLRYLSYDGINNDFELLLDKGDFVGAQRAVPVTIEQETKKLMQYFLIGVSLPNESFWVNLRPDAENNIIDNELAKTDVGKVLLDADLQLKKDTAQFTSPQTKEGRAYWDKLYKKAQELFGYENITIPTLTRPWIVPDEIVIREAPNNAYIYKATLKVMLEEDYLKVDSRTPACLPAGKTVDSVAVNYDFKDPRLKELNKYSTELIKELIIPKITNEINNAKRYASLRQVYYSLIMAQWFKQKFHGREGLYSQLINKQDLTGLTLNQNWSKTTYFKEYQASFKQGEYNLQEPVRTPFGQTIRTYFSGGVSVNVASPLTQVADKLPQPGQIGVVATPYTKVSVMEAKFKLNQPELFSPALLRVIVKTKEQGIFPELEIAKNTTKVSSSVGRMEIPEKEQVRLEKMREKKGVIEQVVTAIDRDEDFSGAKLPISIKEIAQRLELNESAVEEIIKGHAGFLVKQKLWDLIDPQKLYMKIKYEVYSTKDVSSSIVTGNKMVRQAELIALTAQDEAGINEALARYDDAIAEYRKDTTAEGIKLLERAIKKQKRLKKMSIGDLKEEFDVIGADGKPIGERVTRFKAHKEGILHYNANLMIFKRGANGMINFLGQKRDSTKDIFPSKISNGAAGHVKAGQSAVATLAIECAEEVSSGDKKLELKPEDITLIGKEGEHLGVLEMYEYSFFDQREKELLLGVLRDELAGQTEEPVEQIFYEVNEELGVIYLFTYNRAQHEKLREIANKVVTDTKIVYGNYTNNVEAKTLGVVVLKERSTQLQLVDEIVEEVNQKGIGGGGEVAGFMWLNFVQVSQDFRTHPEKYTDAFAPFLSDVRIGGEILQALGFTAINYIPQEHMGGRSQRHGTLEFQKGRPEGVGLSGKDLKPDTKPKASSGIVDGEVGGIDFTTLNFVNHPVILNPVSILGTNMFRNIFSSKNIFRGEALNSELTSLEDMVNKGITPSLVRIKQCVSSCCTEQQSEQTVERLSVCISGVLRMEEEYQQATDPVLLAMLSLLQSGNLL